MKCVILEVVVAARFAWAIQAGDCGWPLDIEALLGDGSDGKYGFVCTSDPCPTVYRVLNAQDSTISKGAWNSQATGQPYMWSRDTGVSISTTGDSLVMQVKQRTGPCDLTYELLTGFSNYDYDSFVWNHNYEINDTHSYTTCMDEAWSNSSTSDGHKWVDGEEVSFTSWCGDVATAMPLTYEREVYDPCGMSYTEDAWIWNYPTDWGYVITKTYNNMMYSAPYDTSEMIGRAVSCARKSVSDQDFTCVPCVYRIKPFTRLDVGNGTAAGCTIGRFRLPVTGTIPGKWYELTLTWLNGSLSGFSIGQEIRHIRARQGTGDYGIWYYPSNWGEIIEPPEVGEVCDYFFYKKLIAARIAPL